ncbi:hypothetical protein ACFQ34_03535, partial [Pseudonocardia benzenivorans]
MPRGPANPAVATAEPHPHDVGLPVRQRGEDLDDLAAAIGVQREREGLGGVRVGEQLAEGDAAVVGQPRRWIAKGSSAAGKDLSRKFPQPGTSCRRSTFYVQVVRFSRSVSCTLARTRGGAVDGVTWTSCTATRVGRARIVRT